MQLQNTTNPQVIAHRANVQRQEDLVRLLKKADEQNVKILFNRNAGFFATSGTHSDIVYAVSEDRCECKGHAYFGRCKHRALLLAELGELPAPPREDVVDVDWEPDGWVDAITGEVMDDLPPAA